MRAVQDVVDKWYELADRTLTQAENIRIIAPHLDMTPAALERAILRAKKAGLLTFITEDRPVRIVGLCKECGRSMVSSHVWRLRTTAEERRESRARGVVGHHSCGLCSNCYERARYHGAERERIKVPTEEVATEWRFLAERDLSTAANIRLLAPRMGMTEAALESAVGRARKAGLLEGIAC